MKPQFIADQGKAKHSRVVPYLTWIGVSVLAIGALVVGFWLGGPKASQSADGSGLRHGVGLQNFRAESVASGHILPMVKGRNVTVIMLMASWCKYCAYDDKYVWPIVAARFPGLQVNIVDVSAHAGIGSPGPRTPAFTGQDNFGRPIDIGSMRALMQIYARRFHLSSANVHVFVNPHGLNLWNVAAFPTILFYDAKGKLLARSNGVLTLTQVRTIVGNVEQGHRPSQNP
jgi:thiol-disulfide isomerase/thioredoxin